MNRRLTILLCTLILSLIIPSVGFAQDAAPPDDGRYMVKFKDFTGAAALVRSFGGSPVRELGPQNVVAALLPSQALSGLRNHPNVEYIEVDPRRYLMGQTTPYGITMVQADDTIFATNNSSGCTVCIIDSGYYRGHEDLQDTAVAGTNDSGTQPWYEDSCGHGSHVAGTVAALSNTVGVVGVNGNGSLNIWIEKVFDGADCAWSYSSDLIAALNRCRNNAGGRKLVVSMSLGGTFSSTTENNAFQNAYDAGVLSVAAAGNAGNTRVSYPAGYGSVISVAAVDANKVVADFSQKNSTVELAAPGVGVLSTTPFKVSSLAVGSASYLGSNIDGSARTSASGDLVDGGLCGSAGAWAGKVVLCERGTYSFAEKVAAVQNGGGVAAAIYNNVDGGFAGTLNGSSTIPAVSVARADGLAALNGVGSSSTVDNTAGVAGTSYNGYEYYDGTSMATPHVSGVAALVWSNFLDRTNADVRAALQNTAEDLGSAGRDNSYGYGLVRARAAYDYLSGSTPPPPPPPSGFTLAVAKTKVKGKSYADLTWSGATTTNVTINRNGAAIATTANDGSYTDGPMSRGSYTYQVCNTDGSGCSNSVTVSF
jgi:subtilisin family serine protease